MTKLQKRMIDKYCHTFPYTYEKKRRQTNRLLIPVYTAGSTQMLRSTLPERRQRVQTFIFCFFPSTITCTVWIFGAQPRLVLRLEWLTRLPDMTPLLQTSQYLPMKVHLLLKLKRDNFSTQKTVLQALFYSFCALFLKTCQFIP